MRLFRAYACVAAILATAGAFAGGTVTNAADLARTLTGGASPYVDFALEARLTFLRDSRGEDITLALEDEAGAAVVHDLRRNSASMAPGDIVEVVGRTIVLNGKHVALATNIVKIAEGKRPCPIKCGVKDLLNGRFDWRLASTGGMVRDAFQSEANPRWVILVVSSEGDNLYVSVPANETPLDTFEALVGREVSIEGVCVPQDLSARNHLGRIFKCSGRSSLRPTSPSLGDPFKVPDVSMIGKLRPAEIATLGRHLAVGRVIAAWNGDNFLLKTRDGKIVRVECTHGQLPRHGDFVEVSGFPETNLYHINLTKAIWRRTVPLSLPEDPVRDITARTILSGKGDRIAVITSFHGQMVRIRGVVRSLPGIGDRSETMYIESDSFIVPVDAGGATNAFRELPVGSAVEVSGVCVLEIENWRPNMVFPRVKGFTVVMRGVEDMKVLSRPSWWTPARLMAIIGTLLLVLAGSLIWNRSLRILAERRSRELLREQIGNMKSKLQVMERTRLAVELHDSVAQSLTAVSMEIAAANELRGDAPTDMMDHLSVAERTLKSCRDELRNCLWDLRNQALDENDMNKAILRTLQPHIASQQLKVTFNVPRSRLSDNTAHAILRIVRELVLNAIRHGKATTICVAGELDKNELRFSIRDDGCGFDPADAPGISQGHYGLQGIRERIDRLGGSLDISSSKGRGTDVTVVMPAKELEN